MGTKQFLRLYYRNFQKSLGQSLIKVLSLGVGFTSLVIVFLFLQYELNYNRCYSHFNRLVLYGVQMTIGGPPQTQGTCNPGVGPILQKYIPEFENYTRFYTLGELLMKVDDRSYFSSGYAMTDTSVFKVFSTELILGNPKTALSDPHSIVLSESEATRIFGNENPLGKDIEVDQRGIFTVTGVMKDGPRNAVASFQGFMPYQAITGPDPTYSPDDFYGDMNVRTYFLIREGASMESIQQKLLEFYDRHMKESDPIQYTSILDPLKSYRLNSNIYIKTASRNRTYFYTFLSIGIIVLLLAIINYINISTSSAIDRAREISMKKVCGSPVAELRWQFILESLLTVFLALALAVSLAEIILSFTSLNQALGRELFVNLFHNPQLLVFLFLALVCCSFLAGWYPATVMANTKPVKYLKGSFSRSSSGRILRFLLVGFQFVLSISAITTVILMSKQIRHMSDSDLGFNSKDFLTIRISEELSGDFVETFRKEISRDPNVLGTTYANVFPGSGVTGYAFKWETEEGPMELVAQSMLVTDQYFPEVMGMEIVQGTGFEDLTRSDSSYYMIVNEAFVREMGWTEPIGKRNELGKVVGVVKDFHHRPLHWEISPLFILWNPDIAYTNLGIRINEKNREQTLARIEQEWNEQAPGIPFNYSFLDDRIRDNYDGDTGQQKLLLYLSIVCVLISGFGLLGITGQNMNNKLGEVTVRKVFGAERIHVVGILLREVIILIGIAALISIPLVLFVYAKWVSGFAYQSGAAPLGFIITDLGMLAFAFFLSLYHMIKTIRINPIDILRQA